MPVVILLDRSLSMIRPASQDEPSQSRLSLARDGLVWLFGYLAEHFPLEYTALVSYSSLCEVAVPFTRDYKLLESKLEDMSVLDRTDLHSALFSLVEIISAEWGSFAPCQVIVVTDGSPGVRHQDSARRAKQPFSVPFPCNISAVCVSSGTELSSRNGFQRLSETLGIAQSDMFVPRGSLTGLSVREAFIQLAKRSFLPFTSLLRCGSMSAPISLSPSPSIQKTNFEFILSSDQSFPSLDKKYPGLTYPTELKVCGFIDTSYLPAPPHYSRHFVLDPDYPEKAFDTGAIGKVESNGESLPVSEDTLKPSFRVLLHGGLKCESKAALIKLREDWYGILYSQTSNSKKSNLVLCVFYPNTDIPWLGPFLYLGAKPFTSTDPRMSQPNKPLFPITPSHLPSFHSPGNMLWAKEALLQTDVSKVIRYCRKLPDKEASLVKELNKLRLASLTFNIPELLDLLCVILEKEAAASNSSSPTKKMLQECVTFFITNKNPQDRLVVTNKQ